MSIAWMSPNEGCRSYQSVTQIGVMNAKAIPMIQSQMRSSQGGRATRRKMTNLSRTAMDNGSPMATSKLTVESVPPAVSGEDGNQ